MTVETNRWHPLLVGLAALVIVGVGIAAEWRSFGPRFGLAGQLDLLTGWVIAGCGLLAWARVPRSRIGPLLVVAGLAWYSYNMGDPTTEVGRGALALTFLYVGVLCHALFTYPSGRIGRPVEWVLVVSGYVMSLFPPLWGHDGSLLLVGGLLAAGLTVQHATLPPEERQARRPALVVGLLLALVLPSKEPVAGWLGDAGLSVMRTPLTVWELTLMTVAIGLAWSLLSRERGRAAMTDVVVRLGEGLGTRDASELRRALGGPDLALVFHGTEPGSYIDGDGRPVAAPGPGDRRIDLPMDLRGRLPALIVTAAALSRDRELAAAVTRAEALGARNAALRTELSAKVTELEGSRRRLLEAGDEERAALEERLRAGVAARLARLTDALGPLEASARISAPLAVARLEHAADQLTRARVELDELARGLDPGLVTEHGLEGAMRDLAGRSPIPVELALAPVATPTPSVAATLYFVASEALANVVRHAAAERAWLFLAADGRRVQLVVEDDGVGGADPGRGSGLRGLRDRLEALGGSLVVAGRPGRGTRLTARIPLGDRTGVPPAWESGAGGGSHTTPGR